MLFEPKTCVLLSFLQVLFKLQLVNIQCNTVSGGGTWVAQLVKHLTSAKVMISWFVSSRPGLSSVLTAVSLPLLHSLSLTLKKNKNKNKQTKKKTKLKKIVSGVQYCDSTFPYNTQCSSQQVCWLILITYFTHPPTLCLLW